MLVDAECTHDGSLKHITKYEQWGWETFEKRFLNEERIASITSLQVHAQNQCGNHVEDLVRMILMVPRLIFVIRRSMACRYSPNPYDSSYNLLTLADHVG